jgi:hypothetical protein
MGQFMWGICGGQSSAGARFLLRILPFSCQSLIPPVASQPSLSLNQAAPPSRKLNMISCKEAKLVRFAVFTAVTMMNGVSWDIKTFATSLETHYMFSP